MTEATLATVTNANAIAVNKDSLGIQGVLRHSSAYQLPPSVPGMLGVRGQGVSHPVQDPTGYQVWSGRLSGSAAVAVLANLDASPKSITLTDEWLPPATLAANEKHVWTITDVYTGKVHCEKCVLPQSVAVGPHDVAFWTLAAAHHTPTITQ
jgi:hypothetical protein